MIKKRKALNESRLKEYLPVVFSIIEKTEVKIIQGECTLPTITINGYNITDEFDNIVTNEVNEFGTKFEPEHFRMPEVLDDIKAGVKNIQRRVKDQPHHIPRKTIIVGLGDETLAFTDLDEFTKERIRQAFNMYYNRVTSILAVIENDCKLCEQMHPGVTIELNSSQINLIAFLVGMFYLRILVIKDKSGKTIKSATTFVDTIVAYWGIKKFKSTKDTINHLGKRKFKDMILPRAIVYCIMQAKMSKRKMFRKEEDEQLARKTDKIAPGKIKKTFRAFERNIKPLVEMKKVHCEVCSFINEENWWQ